MNILYAVFTVVVCSGSTFPTGYTKWSLEFRYFPKSSPRPKSVLSHVCYNIHNNNCIHRISVESFGAYTFRYILNSIKSDVILRIAIHLQNIQYWALGFKLLILLLIIFTALPRFLTIYFFFFGWTAIATAEVRVNPHYLRCRCVWRVTKAESEITPYWCECSLNCLLIESQFS